MKNECMKFFLVLFLGATAMVVITRCNSSSDHINAGKKADSVAPVEGGSYNKDTTSYERSADTGQSHHTDSSSRH